MSTAHALMACGVAALVLACAFLCVAVVLYVKLQIRDAYGEYRRASECARTAHRPRRGSRHARHEAVAARPGTRQASALDETGGSHARTLEDLPTSMLSEQTTVGFSRPDAAGDVGACDARTADVGVQAASERRTQMLVGIGEERRCGDCEEARR